MTKSLRRKFSACGWLVCGVLLACATGGCGGVPQVIDDEAVYGEVDALFTAVTSKRPQLLADCKSRLMKLHGEKRLSDAGFAELDRTMQMCESGDWQPAAQRLYDFMRAQRKSDVD